jgi:integrase
LAYLIVRSRKDGTQRYTGMYRDLSGRARSAGTFTTDVQALKVATITEADAAAGRGADPRRSRQTLRHYVETEWLPHHLIEASTAESYQYLINRYLLPELGDLRMRDIRSATVRQWITRLTDVHGARPPTVRNVKVVFDAVFTTALTDQVVPVHPGRGVRTPPVARKPRRIITAEQFRTLYEAMPDDVMRLLMETDIESGLRWGELTELRVKDLDPATGILTVARVVVHLRSTTRPDGARFLVKHYPKDKEWRQVKLADHLVTKLSAYVSSTGLGPDDLLFPQPQPQGATRRRRPAELPDPLTLGFTEPNSAGRRYRHGTLTAYQAARCRCQQCKDAVATYRAERRAKGKDFPRPSRTIAGDGHLSNDWFRTNIWNSALAAAGLGFRVTPHSLRHAHASWLLAGGADILVVKERLGHGSITTTERYLHTLPDAHDKALRALRAVRGTPGLPDAQATPADLARELVEARAALARFKALAAALGG